MLHGAEISCVQYGRTGGRSLEQESRMSLIFLLHFLLIVSGKMDPQTMKDETFYVWALFAIADALWFRNIFRRDK